MKKKEKKSNQKKELILTIVALVSLVVITLGTTYAFFHYAKEGTTENAITTGTITFLYTEIDKIGKGISISDAFPMSDELGKSQMGDDKVFNFKITSTTTSKNSIPYEITARKDSESTLDENVVKMYLTKVSGDEKEEQVLLNNYDQLEQTEKVSKEKHIEKTLYKDRVPANQEGYEQAYRLRMWIDDKTDFSQTEGGDYPYNNKTFTVTVNVYAEGKVITEEDKELASNVDIKSIKVGDHYAVKVENEEYQYEVGVSSTKESNMEVETVNPSSEVKVSPIENQIAKMSYSEQEKLEEGDNYYTIKVTSEDGNTSKDYTIHIHVGEYKEEILNETDPVLKNNLIPVMIKEDGTVIKVDKNYKWYSYEEKNWANAIILKGEDIYQVGDNIPEEAIESYFVWIPKYSYEIFNMGNYTSLQSSKNAEKIINIRFGTTNTTDDANKKECSTPTEAGSNGSCKEGYYMTHPAFTSFDVNGFWVGKFETGYEGAQTTKDAQVDSSDISKIIIKPNVYSWRNITVGNAFKASYEYQSNLQSHMMKNTEWGAVAYLSHSQYGINQEIRINNNSAFITGYAGTIAPTVGYSISSIEGNRNESTALGDDGTYTKGYFSEDQKTNQLASTTGNKSGIYDMSGGSHEYVMGYTTTGGGNNQSGFDASLYNSKYYDQYSTTSNNTTQYNNRILGDASGEMGPFGNEKSSWYKDWSFFVCSSNPWFYRGGAWHDGILSGAFAFAIGTGRAHPSYSFRIVLAPTHES